MDAFDIASVIVAAIAAIAAIASQRAAAKASTINTNTTSRVDMEKDAYNRARAFDTETIERQNKEIEELREDNRKLHEQIDELREDNKRLNKEVMTLRAQITPLKIVPKPEDDKGEPA